jgi:hypothetical protein
MGWVRDRGIALFHPEVICGECKAESLSRFVGRPLGWLEPRNECTAAAAESNLPAYG